MDSQSRLRQPATIWAIGLGLACVALRAILWKIYDGPVVWPDSAAYLDLARQIRSADFTGYLGTRPPGYPLFLLLSGPGLHAIWFMQSILGILISLMLFAIVYDQTRSPIWSFVVGLSSSASMNLLFFEANIVSETSSIFLVVLSLLLVVKALRAKANGWLLYLALGVVLAVAGLTRPQLLLLAPLYVIFYLYSWSRAGVVVRSRWTYLASLGTPFVALVLFWCFFNSVTVGKFGVTTLTGYSLTNHSGAFMELAPDKYATIRDIYLAHRTKRIAETGQHTMTIHGAIPEMLQATGWSYTRLSDELTRMSLGMFIAHPALYLKGVFRAWVEFWKVRNCWVLTNLTVSGLRGPLDLLWKAERGLLVAANALFLGGGLFALYRLIRRRSSPVPAFTLLVMAVVIVESILQAAVEYGENGRYAIPFQPLVIYTIVAWIMLIRKPSSRASS
jgi:hypothetical protein